MKINISTRRTQLPASDSAQMTFILLVDANNDRRLLAIARYIVAEENGRVEQLDRQLFLHSYFSFLFIYCFYRNELRFSSHSRRSLRHAVYKYTYKIVITFSTFSQLVPFARLIFFIEFRFSLLIFCLFRVRRFNGAVRILFSIARKFWHEQLSEVQTKSRTKNTSSFFSLSHASIQFRVEWDNVCDTSA